MLQTYSWLSTQGEWKKLGGKHLHILQLGQPWQWRLVVTRSGLKPRQKHKCGKERVFPFCCTWNNLSSPPPPLTALSDCLFKNLLLSEMHPVLVIQCSFPVPSLLWIIILHLFCLDWNLTEQRDIFLLLIAINFCLLKDDSQRQVLWSSLSSAVGDAIDWGLLEANRP